MLLRYAPRWRVAWLMWRSHSLYAAKRFSASLTAALAARDLSRGRLGEESDAHEAALLHCAAVYAAMRRNKEALAALSACDALATRLHGSWSLKLVPLLHARAEVLEADGRCGRCAARGRAPPPRRPSLSATAPREWLSPAAHAPDALREAGVC